MRQLLRRNEARAAGMKVLVAERRLSMTMGMRRVYPTEPFREGRAIF